MRDVFKDTSRADRNKLKKVTFVEIVRDNKAIILIMITEAFFDFGDQIKQDADLTKAFEETLEMLVEINFEEAAIILDEFRVH